MEIITSKKLVDIKNEIQIHIMKFDLWYRNKTQFNSMYATEMVFEDVGSSICFNELAFMSAERYANISILSS